MIIILLIAKARVKDNMEAKLKELLERYKEDPEMMHRIARAIKIFNENKELFNRLSRM